MVGRGAGVPGRRYLAWQADVAFAGEFWARFTQPKDAKVQTEKCLGSALAGEKGFPAQDVGLDQTEPGALTFRLRERAP